MAQLRVNDFSGGETDRFRDGKPNFAQTMKNLYVSENRRLFSRPGFGALHTDPRPFGNARIHAMWNHCYLDTFETFALTNGAIMVSSSATVWRSVFCADGTVSAPNWLNSEVPSTKYIRLNENEFVLVDNSGLGNYPTKFYRDGVGGEWQYVTLGLPYYNDPGGSFADPVVAGANNWVYAIVLKHAYTTFESGSGFITKEVRNTPTISRSVNSVVEAKVDLPTFTNSLSATWVDNEDRSLLTDGCFAYSDVIWEIYRTISNGSVFYKIGESLPGTSFPDTRVDSTITSGATLYTTGGAVGNGMPNSRTFDGTYANGTLWQASRQRVWQHKVGIHDAQPGSFVFTVREGQAIVSVNSLDVYPIVLTNKGIYRIEGIVDDLGNGTHRVRTISETDGALSSRSTVKAGDRLYYLASDGIYMTNGYTSSKVSKHYNDKYKEFLGQTVYWNGAIRDIKEMIVGVWDKYNRRIHWMVRIGNTLTSTVLTLDLKFPHEEGLCITSGEIPFYVRDAKSEGGNIQVGTQQGYLFDQDISRTFDVDESNNLDPKGIEWDYVSCSLAFGSSLIRKFFTRLLLHFTNKSDLTVKVQSDTDESNDYRDHNAIRERGFTRGLYFLKRWFPKGKLRGTYKTIRISNEAQTLFRSDDYDLADRSGSSVIIDSGVWPAGVEVGYYLSVETDNYTAQYRITVFGGGDTITVSPNLPGSVPSNDFAWQIKGIPTTESIEMNGYTVDYHTPQEGHTQSATVVQGND